MQLIVAIVNNPIGIGLALLFFMLLFGLYKIFNGIGFRITNMNDDGKRKWELWVDNRERKQKKEPSDTNN